jgi:AraC-like DNA-binding protein
MQSIRYYLNGNNTNIEIKKCTNSVHSTKAHFHNEVSIALIESGTSQTEIENKVYEFTDRTFLIIPPTIVHECNPTNLNNWNFRMLHINPHWFETAFNIQSSQLVFSNIKLQSQVYSTIIELFNNLEKNIFNIEDESKLLDCISLLIDVNPSYKNYQITNLKLVNKLKEFLDLHYLNNVTLNDLVEVSGISKYYLIRQFENCYGLSPHKYLTTLRINHSKTLLKTKKLFVDIALESGFYDQSHFTKCFKEYTGVTPKKYRNSFIL